jgi:thymidylate kinase
MNTLSNTDQSLHSFQKSSKNFLIHKPVYIAVEGIKGVGKGTVLNEVRRRLKSDNIHFLTLNPTQAMPAQHPYEILDRLLPLRRYDWWRKLLYALRSRFHSSDIVEQRIIGQSQGKHMPLILGDRSFLTSLVTRWPKDLNRCSLDSHFSQVRHHEPSIPLPDHVIYLQADLELIMQRISARCRDYGQEDENRLRLEQAHQHYLTLAQTPPRALIHTQWHFVDANQSIAQVSNAVYQYIKDLINADCHVLVV